MRRSYFCRPQDFPRVAAAGYDGVELFIQDLMALDAPGLRAAARSLSETGLRCEVCTNPMPQQERIASDSFSMTQCRAYLAEVVDRTAKLGVRAFVFGNSVARRLPEGQGREAARQKIEAVIAMLCELAGEAGITILLEPLGSSIDNCCNTLDDALAIIGRLGQRNLATLLDYRWFLESGQPLDTLPAYAKAIRHVHIDYPYSTLPRRVPPRLDDGHDYDPLFQALQRVGYQGIVSIEATVFDDLDRDLRDGMRFLRAHMPADS